MDRADIIIALRDLGYDDLIKIREVLELKIQFEELSNDLLLRADEKKEEDKSTIYDGIQSYNEREFGINLEPITDEEEEGKKRKSPLQGEERKEHRFL